MTEKGCDNCYYTYFDERAYPCSLCIRGIERTDQWQPSKKTKAEQTEPQTDTDFTLTYTCSFSDCENFKHFGFGEKCIECKRKQSKAMRKTEPQTEMEKSGSKAVQTARCLNCHNAKDCKENHWEVCRYEPWKLTAVEDEPQTDCSWKKGE